MISSFLDVVLRMFQARKKGLVTRFFFALPQQPRQEPVTGCAELCCHDRIPPRVLLAYQRRSHATYSEFLNPLIRLLPTSNGGRLKTLSAPSDSSYLGCKYSDSEPLL